MGTCSIIQGADPTNETGSSTTIDEDFDKELDNFLGRND